MASQRTVFKRRLIVDRQQNRALLLRDRRLYMTDEDQKAKAPAEVVFLEKKVKDRARIT